MTTLDENHQVHICPLCQRELGSVLIEEHHLIPKTFKGKDTVKLHKVCHRLIHATFAEKQLEKYYHTIERLASDEKVQRFIEWVKNKPLDFYISFDETTQRKSARWK